jgi:hypothetical protein
MACLIAVPSNASALSDSANTDHFHQTVVATLDLTGPFSTRSKWRLVVTQDPDDQFGSRGQINFCFVKNETPECSGGLNNFRSIEIIRPLAMRESALLVAKTDGTTGGSGYPIETTVWIYRPKVDRFEGIFSHQSNVAENEETRVIAKGPLAGDIVENEPISRWPYPYAIRVYALSDSRHYREVLAYKGKSRWGDGNRLGVVDAEMLEIEKRLHAWNPSGPLPRPVGKPAGCVVSLHDGLLWCP